MQTQTYNTPEDLKATLEYYLSQREKWGELNNKKMVKFFDKRIGDLRKEIKNGSSK